MTSDISDRILALGRMTVSETNVVEIGNRWLSICGELFTDDAGFELGKNGGYDFIPSTLNHNVSTTSLSELLRISDEFERYRDTAGLQNENWYLNSILLHIRQRADKGDARANDALRIRVEKKMAHSAL